MHLAHSTAERRASPAALSALTEGASRVFLTFWLLAAKIHSRFFFCFVPPFPSISTSFHFLPPQFEHFKSISCSSLLSRPSAECKTCSVALSRHLHSTQLCCLHKVWLIMALAISEQYLHRTAQELPFPEFASSLESQVGGEQT